MEIAIPGNPIPKKRHRTFRSGGKTITWDPQGQEKSFVKMTMVKEREKLFLSPDNKKSQEAILTASAEEIDVEMYFDMAIPKKWTQRRKNMALWQFVKPSVKPDIDNLIKFYFDCANGILFEDDKKIISIKSIKRYALKPQTKIKIIRRKSMGITKNQKKMLEIYGPPKIQRLKEIIDILSLIIQDEIYEKKVDEIIRNLTILANEHSIDLNKIRILAKKEEKHV